MRVSRVHNRPLTYEVESWTTPHHPHTVDLSEVMGNGACTCDDFTRRCLSNLSRHPGGFIPYGAASKPNPERTMCRHIMAARTKFLNDILREIARGNAHIETNEETQPLATPTRS